MKPRIAIIGAGISGLTLAQNLKDCADISVYEKARGVGGRMSTRYADPFYFDHGAQFFTARSPLFQSFIAPFIADGLVKEWKGKVITFQAEKEVADRIWFEPHYVAVPNMNSLCKHLANGLNIHLGVEVSPLLAKADNGWQLCNKDGEILGVYDWVISTAPPAQTQRLFSACMQEWPSLLEAKLLGCYTLMIGFNHPWKQSWMAAKVHDSPIEWIAINSSKPGRNHAVTSILVHSNNIWAEEHIDDDMKEAEAFLCNEFKSITGIDTLDAAYLSCHRWRFAINDKQRELSPLIDYKKGIACTGDWCTASRIEDAWLNACNLSNSLRNYFMK